MSVVGSSFCRGTAYSIRNSATHVYETIWKQHGINYAAAIGRENMDKSPHLIERIKLVEARMKQTGYTSFVHASPAGASVLRKCYNALYGKVRFFQYLRPKDARFAVPWKKATALIPRPGDHSQKSHLLSVGYSLASSLRPGESPAYWGFVNHFGAETNFDLLRELDHFLDANFKERAKTKAYFRQKGWELIQKYGGLKLGDFTVIGVPRTSVRKYVYDSLPYNIPTGKDAARIAAHPEKHFVSLKDTGHIASLIVCNETLSPNSGIVMVRANAAREVSAFCQRTVFKKSLCSFENEERQKRLSVDSELACFAAEITEAIRNPEKSFSVGAAKCSLMLSDFVPLAI
jgi:hypothetical protein